MFKLDYAPPAGGSPFHFGNMSYSAAALAVALFATEPSLAQEAAQPSASVTDVEGFDRGTGTGEPSETVAHRLRLMKKADDGFNVRDWGLFLDQLHSPEVVVHQFGVPTTVGHAPHRADMEFWTGAFPDMRVHNDPYDIQFGQGDWTVAIGKLSGTFKNQLKMPNGTIIEPTGKSFLITFTTIAKWKNDQMDVEYVLMDTPELMKQIGVGQ